MPAVLTVLIDGVRQATGMRVDAALVIEEFLLGEGVSQVELDLALVSMGLKMQKFFEGLVKINEVFDKYEAELGHDPLFSQMKVFFRHHWVRQATQGMDIPAGLALFDAAGFIDSPNVHDTVDAPMVRHGKDGKYG